MVTTKGLLSIIALVCFILAAIGIAAIHVNLIAVGLAFWVAASLCRA